MGDSKLSKRFFNNRREEQAAAYWPQASILTVFQRIYDNVDYMDSEDSKHYYQVSLNGLNFIAILSHAENAPTKIMQYGFVCYFAGLEITMTGMESLNRNLHISVAELDEHKNLILFSFIEAHGSFDENRFSLQLQAWHRDIVITFKWIIPETSLGAMMSTKALSMVRRHGENKVGTGSNHPQINNTAFMNGDMKEDKEADISASPPDNQTSNQTSNQTNHQLNREAFEMLSRFLGAQDARRSLCDVCEGRGKIGMFSRSCKKCEGSGLLAPCA